MKKKTSKIRTVFILSITLIIASSLLLLGADDTRVYVTNSGKKYHREDCGSLGRSKIGVSLEDAIQSGYEPCKVCNPPVGSSKTAPITPEPNLYRVNRANLLKTRDAQLSLMVPAEVVGHVDGDTVRVRISNPPLDLKTLETIRMIGVDTPETVHPNKPVEYFGQEASNFTKERLLGKQVYLAFDWDLRDRYGRLLAYIYTAEGRCFNGILIQEGYGHAYISYPFQFRTEFEDLEQSARNAKRGLWGNAGVSAP
jgi:micrococcal nuclease